MIKIFLPFLPPSVNTAYPTNRNGRRFKSDKYVAFQADCGVFMRKCGSIKGEVEMEINLFWSDKRRRDICNFEKCVSDTLVEYGVIEDDSLIKRMVIEYHKGEPETRILIKKYETA